MKSLVISDTHLTHKFDQTLYEKLSLLISSADHVVINGDFWDAFLTTFDKFCNSAWNQLFPLLKQKKAVYVYGNHDKAQFMDERIKLFSERQALKFDLKSGNKTIIIQHGHLLTKGISDFKLFGNPKAVRFLYQTIVFLSSNVRLFEKFLQKLQRRFDLKGLNHLKNYVIINNHLNLAHVFGHTHVFEFDLDLDFHSVAFNKPGGFSYAMVEDGEIKAEKLG